MSDQQKREANMLAQPKPSNMVWNAAFRLLCMIFSPLSLQYSKESIKKLSASPANDVQRSRRGGGNTQTTTQTNNSIQRLKQHTTKPK